MKSNLLTLLLLLISKIGFAQELSPNDKIIFLDSTWHETKKETHFYFRIIKDCKTEKESYAVSDHFKSGAIQMEGRTSSRNELVKEGEVTFYYENGNKKSVTNFVKDRPLGKETKWYENGNKKEIREYFIDNEKRKTTYKIEQYWDSKGTQKVKDGNGDYQISGKNIFLSGNIKDGVKDGVWEGWANEAETKCTEIYKDGEFVSGTTIDENGIKFEYDVLEKKPEPQNGIADFYRFVGKNFNFFILPEGVSGKVYISFVVDEDGKIINPKVLKDIGYGTGAEALRILSDYGNWNPGEKRGKKVKSSYTLPINLITKKSK